MSDGAALVEEDRAIVEAGSRRRGLLLAVCAAALWATGGLGAKWLFSPLDATTSRWLVPPLGVVIDPVVLSAARAIVATTLLWAGLAARSREHLRVRAQDLPFLAVFGVAGLALVHFSYFKTISLTNVATAILLEYMAPVLVLAATAVVFRRKVGWRLPVAVGASVAGCALVAGAASGALAVSPEGLAWGLASAVFFASYTLMGRWASTRYTPWTLLAYGLAAASVFWIVVLGGPGSVVSALADARTLAAVGYIAIASTILPFGAFLAALRLLPAAEASVASTLEPVIAAAGAWALLGERLSASQIVGGGLVLLGIVVAQTESSGDRAIPPAA
ncbi:MAG: EamA family transporter [Coriobacteriia bacterium]|nr:EamA family transporter [Coriobacteriia bacterium]